MLYFLVYICLHILMFKNECSVLWQNRREQVLAQSESSMYRKYWRAIMKNDLKLDEASRQKVQLERTFLAQHIQKYFHVLDSISEKGSLCYRNYIQFVIGI